LVVDREGDDAGDGRVNEHVNIEDERDHHEDRGRDEGVTAD